MSGTIRKRIYKPMAGAHAQPASGNESAPEIRGEPAAVTEKISRADNGSDGTQRDGIYRPAADDRTLPSSGSGTGTEHRRDDAASGSDAGETVSTAGMLPYAEFGGLSPSVRDRRQEAERRRTAAMEEWQRRLKEQERARLALFQAAKPEDTTDEQRKLRNLAIGQAVGEFVGALFGGIHGLGSRSARGYVPKMPGMYRKTLDRLQQLKNHDILANQRFRGLMGSMLERNAGDRATLARERWRDAADEAKRLHTAQEYMDREAMRAGNRRELHDRQTEKRRELSERQAELRRDLQQERHEQRLAEQEHAAAVKSGMAGNSDDVAYLTKLLLPKTRTSTQTGGKFSTTTVRDATSYSRQEVAAATALAKQIAPIRKRFGLSDYDTQILQDAVRANPSAGVGWQQIDEALSEGYSVDDIVIFIRKN